MRPRSSGEQENKGKKIMQCRVFFMGELECRITISTCLLMENGICETKNYRGFTPRDSQQKSWWAKSRRDSCEISVQSFCDIRDLLFMLFISFLFFLEELLKECKEGKDNIEDKLVEAEGMFENTLN